VKRILGLLGWLGIVLVVAALVLRYAKPEWQDASRYLAFGGLIATLIYAASQWRDIGRSFQGRNVRYGSMAAGGAVLFLGILVGINWIGSREHKRWDLTAGQQFSLSDQTKKILADISKPVNIKVFYDSQRGDREYRDRFAEFQYLSKQVSVEYIDAVKDPITTKRYDVQTYGTVVMEYNGRTEKTTSIEESDLVNALKKLIEGKAKKVYFTQGHGEHDTAASDPGGYSGLASALQTDNFEVAKVTLAQEGKVPDDATLLVIAGPKADFLAPEVDSVRKFLATGGKLLLFLDPPDKADSAQPASLIALAKDWGIDVGNNLVVDASGIGRLIGTDASVPIAMPAPGGHPITDNFKLMTAFPLTRSVTPVEGGTSGKVAQKVIETSPRSWAETDLKGLFATGKPELNVDKGDKQGPVTLAAAVSSPAQDAPAGATPDAPKPEARVVVVGDSDFVSNGAIGIGGNKDLGLNMANWAAQQENMIAIRPKDPQDRRIQLTQDQGTLVFWLTFAIIPVLLLLNGVRVWWRRR
jgi:ABC-type uncharacterized transport system involved in gliding motility auxiliary subunit